MTGILNCFMSQRAVYMEMLTVDSFSNNVNLSKRCTNIAVGGLQKKKKKTGTYGWRALVQKHEVDGRKINETNVARGFCCMSSSFQVELHYAEDPSLLKKKKKNEAGEL